MVRRFSDLKKSLKYIQNITWEPGDPVSNAPAGSPLANYQAWMAGNNREIGPRDAGSKTLGLEEVTINPFAVEISPTTAIKVPISKRVLDSATLAGVRTSANVLIGGGIVAPKGFKPAQAVVYLATGTTTSPEPSKITGLKYAKNSTGHSFTVPMGQKTGEIYEKEVQDSVKTAVALLSGEIKTASFKPEIWR